MTPNELNLIVGVYGDKLKMEYEERIIVAYFGEYFHRQEVLKPSIIHEVLGKTEEKQMTDLEMLINVQQLNAMFGGNVE
jgi:hypothetical protein